MSYFIAFLSLILGLYFLRNNIIISALLTVVFIIFIFYRFKPKKAFLFLTIFSIGALIGNINLENNKDDHNYTGIVVEVKDNYFLFQSGLEKFYVYEKENDREVGDILVIDASPSNVSFTTYESQLNFNTYLKDKGVKRSLSSYDICDKFNIPIRIRKVQKKFLATLDNDTSTLVDAFLFNHKDYQNEVINAANDLNLIFLFSTSGIYLNFILSLLEKIFFLKFNEKTSRILSLLLVFPFCIFSFSKIGVVRVILSKFITCFKSRKIKIPSNILSASILLILDYHFAYQQGFYIGVYVSIVFTILLKYFMLRFKNKKKRLITPLIIYLIVFPFVGLSSGSFHVFSLLFQTLSLPIFTITMCMSVLTFYKLPFKWSLKLLYSIISKLLNIFSKVDLVIPIADFGPYYKFVFIILTLFLFYLLDSKRHKHALKFSWVISAFFLVSLIPIKNVCLNAVYFVNVGQGDCVVIQNKFHAVMIDTGGVTNSDLTKKTLIPFLHKKQIYKLDALITTHDDYDHSGAAESLKENFKVKKHLSSRQDFPYQVGDINLVQLNEFESDDENDSSLVLKMDFMDKKWLFTADISTNVEKYMIENGVDLDCDILKIGHHGSNTSTSLNFLNATSPNEAIVSVGANNKYKHPSDEVINRLNEQNIKIRRTDEEGTISYYSIFA